MAQLQIIIRWNGGTTTVYRGIADWSTDPVTMQHVEGPVIGSYDHTDSMPLEFHAALCRAASWGCGLDTQEIWSGDFKGGQGR